MERSKLVAIITGAISLILALAYLILVQLLDFRGEMIPAPVSQLPQGVEVASECSIQICPLIPQPLLPPGEKGSKKIDFVSNSPLPRWERGWG
jgi:hypothetical protein